MSSILEALTVGEKRLAAVTDNGRREAETLLCHVLACDRLKLFMDGTTDLTREQIEAFYGFVHRRVEGEPLQYLTGTQGFMGLEFEVKPGVLIPRSDTEVLVATTLRQLAEMRIYWHKDVPSGGGRKVRQLRVLDLGTGSGAIALSIAHYDAEINVTAVDLSEVAIEVTRRNCHRLDLDNRVRIIASDMFEFLEAAEPESYELIVSNPPYIPTSVIDTLQIEVRDHEPKLALDGGPDGLLPYRQLAKMALKPLVTGGRLTMEVGHDQAATVKEFLLDANGWEKVECFRDLQGIDRVVTALKKL